MSSFTAKQRLLKNESFIIFAIALAIGIISAISLFLLDNNSLLYYGDAISHLTGARKFVDWMEPGLIQMGTVWLPLPHLLLLPFSLVDQLFSTGFAGLMVSLPCHAITSVLLYKIIKEHVGNSKIGIIGAFLYAANPSLIYLGITAMTEAPFMLFFVAFAYYFQKWNNFSDSEELSEDSKNFLQRNELNYLLLSSVFISLATLCRYEAWILVIVFVPYLFFKVIRKRVEQKTKLLSILISLISLSGILFWMIWNVNISGDPLEFVNAEFYSASYQALDRTPPLNLFLEPINIVAIYGMTVGAMYGPVLLVLALIGYIKHLKENNGRKKRTIFYAFLSLPPFFTILMLLFGIGEMNQWWFNSRFVILISPLIIILASFFIANLTSKIKRKNFTIVAIIASLFIVYGIIPFFGVITYIDAEEGFIFKHTPYAFKAGEFLKSEYDDGNLMIMTGSMQSQKIMISSGIPLKQFDDMIESHTTWKPSFKEPWKYDKWIIMSSEPDSDSVVPAKYWEDRSSELEQHYQTVFENKYYKIMLRN